MLRSVEVRFCRRSTLTSPVWFTYLCLPASSSLPAFLLCVFTPQEVFLRKLHFVFSVFGVFLWLPLGARDRSGMSKHFSDFGARLWTLLKRCLVYRKLFSSCIQGFPITTVNQSSVFLLMRLPSVLYSPL